MDYQAAEAGHNNPPSDAAILTDLLKEKYDGIEGRVAQLYEAAHKVPKVESAEVADKVTTLIKQIAVADKNATKCKGDEKRPHLDANKTIEAYFKPFGEALKTAKTIAGQKLTTYQVEQQRLASEAADKARKEAEAKAKAEQEAASNEVEKQRADKAAEKASTIKAADTSVRTDYGQTASLRTKTVFAIEDRSKVTAVLLQYLSDDDILKAARAAHADGITEIPGVSVTKEQQAVVK
ncbi:hypothetical protein [Kiloniella antarctica]|uniref:Uncharacterized protein n=1 Tax=Kiloniella antarctica TaxID=1550907 RepID=A0ABW5BQZ5_9PROT